MRYPGSAERNGEGLHAKEPSRGATRWAWLAFFMVSNCARSPESGTTQHRWTKPALAAPVAAAASAREQHDRQLLAREFDPVRLVNYRLESTKLGPVPVVVRVPKHVSAAPLPVLILLHGRGEAQKAPERGARGFLDDYALERSWSWLEAQASESLAPPEVPLSFRKSVKAQVDEHPFSGMVLVMPYLPDRFRGSEAFTNAAAYAEVLRQLIVSVKAELPVRQDPEGWALDGISLGGRVAMVCASELAPLLGAQGSVQAAVDQRELELFAERLVEARRINPKLHHVLATSEQDYFRVVLERHHANLSHRGLRHSWVVLPGDHSYAFNRGPGVTHLLLTYDRWFSRVE